MGKTEETFVLDRQRAALVLVDQQEKIVAGMHPELAAAMVANTRLLIDGFRAVGVPVLATEQYPQGLGCTVPELAEGLEPLAKTEFSCAGVPAFLEDLERRGIRQVLLTGAESHVCVYLTAIDLLDRGYRVHVARDAVASRFLTDYAAAMDGLARAGAVITTTEMALFQLVRRAGTPEFKAISKLVRHRG